MSRKRIVSGVRVVGRLFICTGGFLAGAFAAGVFMALALVLSERGEAGDTTVLALSIFIALFAAGLSFLPAAIAIVVTEILALRSLALHGVAGVAIAVAAGLMQQLKPGEGFQGSEPSTYLALYLGAGAIAGLVYWAIAGRHAGTIYERRYEKDAALNAPPPEEA